MIIVTYLNPRAKQASIAYHQALNRTSKIISKRVSSTTLSVMQ